MALLFVFFSPMLTSRGYWRAGRDNPRCERALLLLDLATFAVFYTIMHDRFYLNNRLSTSMPNDTITEFD